MKRRCISSRKEITGHHAAVVSSIHTDRTRHRLAGRVFSGDVLAMIFTMVASEMAMATYKLCRDVFAVSGKMGCEDDLWKQMLWTPSILAAVCRHWRYICRGTPSVWAHMAIVFVGGQKISRSRQFDDVLRRLSFAKTHPLHVYLCGLDTREAPIRKSAYFSAIRRAIWDHASSWKRLHLLQTYNGEDPFWSSLNTVPNQLEAFSIVDPTISTWESFNMSGWAGVTHFSLDIRAASFPEIELSQLPSLTHVTLRLQTRRTFSIPLNITDDDLLHAISLISDCALLLFLRIEIPDKALSRATRTFSDEVDLSSFFIKLRFLLTLHLIGFDSCGPLWSKLLQYMHFPSLRHLIMDEPVTSRLGEALKSWKCPLETLSLTIDPNDPYFHLSDEIVEVAQGVTSLSIFTLSDSRPVTLIDQLSDPSVVPKLTSLMLGLHHTSRLLPLRLRSYVGFDIASSFRYLLLSRDSLTQLTAAVTCSTAFIADLDAVLDSSLDYYYVWTFGESADGFVLEKGKPPSSPHQLPAQATSSMSASVSSPLVLASPPHSMDQYSALNHFSNDLLRHIFHYFVDEFISSGISHCNHLFEEGRNLDSLHVDTQLVLTSLARTLLPVCQQWHTVCMEDPSLWTTVLIPFIGDFGDSYSSTILNNLHSTFTNSNSLPITIHFYALDGHLLQCRDAVAFDSVCKAVSTEGHRWGRLSFIQHTYSDVPSSLNFDPFTPTHLQHFRFTDIAFANWDYPAFQLWTSCTDVTLDIHTQRYIDIPLAHLPSLTRLVVLLHDDTVSPSSWMVKNLIDVDAVNHAFAIAMSCSTLQELTISIPFDSDTDWSEWKAPRRIAIDNIEIRHDNLRRLFLKGYRRSGPHYSDFLVHCIFPNLIQFSMDEPAPSNLSHVISIRWNCRLSSLSITIDPSNEFYTFPDDLLAATQDVSVLTVTAWGYFRTTELVLQLCDEGVFPLLTHLKLDVMYPGSARLLRIAHSRNSMLGFDHGSSLLLLIRERPLLEQLSAIVCHSAARIQHLHDEMASELEDFEIIAFIDCAQIATLRKGFRPYTTWMPLVPSPCLQLTTTFPSSL